MKYIFVLFFVMFSSVVCHASEKWQKTEDSLFVFIYQARYAQRLPHIISSAHAAISANRSLFSYKPSEKTFVIVSDFKDRGGASATFLPHNMVTLEISPFDLSYEFIRQNDMMKWLLSHELVHVAMSDQSSRLQNFFRAIFGKANPVSDEPLSLPYALITGHDRYTPTWYQEGIAVFMETWYNGGFGRLLGNFDEMFYRAMVYERKPFMRLSEVNFDNDHSFLAGSSQYLYGARFMTHLVVHHGPQKLFDWMSVGQTQVMYANYKVKFKRIYGLSIAQAWRQFEEEEYRFQQENISRIEKNQLTNTQEMCPPQGWVSRSYPDSAGKNLYFAAIRPGELSQIKRLDLTNGKLTGLRQLPTPGLYNVASTAFDKSTGLFYYTTHNEAGYRDLYAYDVNNNSTKKIFSNFRLGDLSVNPADHALFGIGEKNGQSILMHSAYPFRDVSELFTFETGVVFKDISVSPDGTRLAGVLRLNNGQQSLIVVHLNKLLTEKRFVFDELTSSGNPEHASWSPDGNELYWDALPSGVSNIFRMKLPKGAIEPVSNVATGLFQPSYISKNKLSCFKYSSDGFQPCFIQNIAVPALSAITFYAQQLVDSFPRLKTLSLKPDSVLEKNLAHNLPATVFRPLANVKSSNRLFTLSAWRQPFALPHNIVRLGVAAGLYNDHGFSDGLLRWGGFDGDWLMSREHTGQYRSLTSLPGTGRHAFTAKKMLKCSLEDILPSLDIGLPVGKHYLRCVNASLFSQTMWSHYQGNTDFFVNAGTQANVFLKNFYIFDSQISAGYGHARDEQERQGDEFFASFKLF